MRAAAFLCSRAHVLPLDGLQLVGQRHSGTRNLPLDGLQLVGLLCVIMANIVATPHWAEIQRLAELGVPISKLAEDFEVNINTLWGRATKNDWLLPRRVRAKIQAIEAKQSRDPLLGGGALSKIGERAFVETWQEKAEHIRTISYEAAVEAIESSKGQIVIESASDLKHAVHVARQATGLLDTDAPQIQLSLFGSGDICGPSIMENECQGVVELQQEQEPDGFWG